MSFPPRYRTARATGARSRGELSGEESRAKAVQAAIELFSASGFRGTSIAAVAEREGLVRTTIAVMDGLQQQWLIEPEEISMVAEFTAFVDALRTTWGTEQPLPARPGKREQRVAR